MPWWGWIVVGAVLLSAELAWVDADFYLVFLGVAALVVGGSVYAVPELPVWAQWLGFGALSVLSMLDFRTRLYAKVRGSPPGFEDGLIGERATASEAIAPGKRGRGELRGSVWTLHNVGDAPLAPGDAAEVLAARGLVLEVAAPEA